MSVCLTRQLLKTIVPGLISAILAGCIASTPTKEEAQSVKSVSDPRLSAEFDQAVSILKSGDRNRAFKMFTHIAKKYPNSSGAHINIGLAYLSSNKLDQAAKAFNNALKINDKNVVAHNGLGVVLRKQGKFKEAETAYLTALSIDSNYANAHLNIGILNDIYYDDPGKALHHYQEYMKHAAQKDKIVEKWIIDVQRRSKSAAGGNKG